MYLHSLSVLNCFVLAMQMGNTQYPANKATQWRFPVSWKEHDALWVKKCSGLALKYIACSCALKMIFLSLPYNIHQRTLQKLQECVVLKGTAYHSHSAPYQSDMITAQLKLFLSFFLLLYLFSHKMSLQVVSFWDPKTSIKKHSSLKKRLYIWTSSPSP